jgi:diguanylate cyclase (GGDEF)-like protein
LFFFNALKFLAAAKRGRGMEISGKKLSIGSRSLRPQLVIAFCLMSVIPVLALLSFIFPSLLPSSSLRVVVTVVAILAVAGFLLIKKIVDSIIEINAEARLIAHGDLSHKQMIERNDELGELSLAMNQLAQQIKGNMDELKIYGERTKDINVQINKQLVALSGLLQIGNLITKNADLKEIFETSVSRLVQAANPVFAFLLMRSASSFEVGAHYGLKASSITAMKLPSNAYLFRDCLGASPCYKADSGAPAAFGADLLKVLDARQLLAYPVLVQGEPKGLIAIGHQAQRLTYNQEDVELLGIFAKQVSIAVENSFLSYKVKELEVKDSLTGLYNKSYIVGRLDEEILRAISHQRPCSFLVIRILNLREVARKQGVPVAESILKKVAELTKAQARNFDKAGRMDDADFGIVLPEKNKRQAQEFAEQFEEKARMVFLSEPEMVRPVFWICVVENPIDGMDAAALLGRVRVISEKTAKA